MKCIQLLPVSCHRPLVASRPLLHKSCLVNVPVPAFVPGLAFLEVDNGEEPLHSGACTCRYLVRLLSRRTVLSPASSSVPGIHHSKPCCSEGVEMAVLPDYNPHTSALGISSSCQLWGFLFCHWPTHFLHFFFSRLAFFLSSFLFIYLFYSFMYVCIYFLIS